MDGSFTRSAYRFEPDLSEVALLKPPALPSKTMLIGIDASGKFTTDLARFEPTVVAAAVGPESTLDEIASWTRDALKRWGYPETVTELHGKELRLDQTREVCELVADRGDIRLAAVVTDPGMLRSPDAIARHRHRQCAKAAEMRVTTEQGDLLKAAILKQLGSRSLRDHEYVLSACLPMVLTAAAQKAIAFFADDAFRPDMERFVVRIDRSPPRRSATEAERCSRR